MQTGLDDLMKKKILMTKTKADAATGWYTDNKDNKEHGGIKHGTRQWDWWERPNQKYT